MPSFSFTDMNQTVVQNKPEGNKIILDPFTEDHTIASQLMKVLEK